MSSRMSAKLDQDEFQSYKAAFHAFDWNNNGKISSASLQVEAWLWLANIIVVSPKAAMGRAAANPTDVEVLDIINRIDNETGYLDFPVSWKIHLECWRWSCFLYQEFCYVMSEAGREMDLETGYKETFRVFSKDVEGCIPAEEIK